MPDSAQIVKRRSSSFESFLVRLAGARVVLLFAFHALVFVTAYIFSYLLRFEFNIPPDYTASLKSTLLVVVGLQLIVGSAFGFYRGWWRYVGLADVVRLVFGLSTATALLVIAWYVGPSFGLPVRYVKPPRGILLIDWAFSLLMLFGTRVVIRLGRDRLRPTEYSGALKRVLIIGAGDAGETLAREIEHRPQLAMKVVAFVDDQRTKWGSHIRGIRVYGPISSVGTIADTTNASEALIAIPSASGKRVREVIRFLSEADLQFKTIPGFDKLVSGDIHVTQLRPVNVEDLLRRDAIQLPGDPVRDLFKDQRVLVTGAGGTIGSELCAQILRLEPDSLVLLERSEYALYEVKKRLAQDVAWASSRVTCRLMDLGDKPRVEQLIAAERPQIVLHAAAHKHVPMGEENAAEYVRNNTLATRDFAELCDRLSVQRFVFISTDKAINPTSVMGASKRAAEIFLLDLARQSRMKVTTVRFGNVIGSSGSVIPLFFEQIAAGGPVTVTHPEVTRYFIRTSEAVSLVLQAASLGDNGHVFMLDMGEPMKIVDLARDMIRLSNHTEDEIAITFTGLRPGEKLFEEVRLNGESIRPTTHPHIVVTSSDLPSSTIVMQRLGEMRAATTFAGGGDKERIVEVLRQLIPEFANGESEPKAPASPLERALA